MQLDLNLLTALDALLEEASVAAAAERLHLSAPAMSRTLGRIRRTTGDQILVRTGRTMIPTPHALAIRAQVHELVRQAQAVLAPERELDLATLDRIFTITCHDALTTAMAPALLAAIRAQAPSVRVRLLAEASTDTPDLRRGEVDLEIGSAAPGLAEVRSETVVHDDLVVVVSADHALAGGELTAQRYAQAAHVTVSRRGRLRDPIDDALAALGLARQVVASTPTSTAALSVVREGTVVVTAPRRTCQPIIVALGLRTRPLPFTCPQVPIVCAWHQRYEDDRAHRWLRQQVHAVLREVCGAHDDTGSRTIANPG